MSISLSEDGALSEYRTHERSTMQPAEIAGLVCRPARTLDEFNELLRLQADVYASRGMVDDAMCDELRDRWVDQSIYFGAFLDDKPVGVARLIPYSQDFHCWDIFEVHAAWGERFEGMNLERCAYEVSALSVPRDAPGGRHAISAALYRAMFQFSLAEARFIWFAGISPVLGRILNRRLGIPLDVIGPGIDYMGSRRMPIIIDLIEFLQRARVESPDEWAYFTNGLEIDLTDQAEPLVPIPPVVEFPRAS